MNFLKAVESFHSKILELEKALGGATVFSPNTSKMIRETVLSSAELAEGAKKLAKEVPTEGDKPRAKMSWEV
jgi:hypothetical protein